MSAESEEEAAAMLLFWTMERERGSDVAIIGTGVMKRVMKNEDLLNMIYFLRRWSTRTQDSISRRRYSGRSTRRYRQVLNSKKTATNSLTYWLARLLVSNQERATARSWSKEENRAEHEYRLRRMRRLLSSWMAWHADNNYGGGYITRSRKIKAFKESKTFAKLSMIVRVWRAVSALRGATSKELKSLRNSYRLHKAATIWSRHALKDAFNAYCVVAVGQSG